MVSPLYLLHTNHDTNIIHCQGVQPGPGPNYFADELSEYVLYYILLNNILCSAAALEVYRTELLPNRDDEQLQQRVEELQQHVEELQQHFEELRSQIALQGQDILRIEQHVQALGNEVARIREAIQPFIDFRQDVIHRWEEWVTWARTPLQWPPLNWIF
jgi:hypothetical protein